MRRHRLPPELIKFLEPYDSEIRDLALRVRDFVLSEMAPCYETIFDAYSAVALGYGWSERFSDGVFHVAVYTRHVNLGFNHGATLDDPARILEGQGSQIRHLSIKSPDDLKRPEICAYVRRAIAAAYDDALKLGGASPSDFRKRNQVITRVKAASAKKRRPLPKRKS